MLKSAKIYTTFYGFRNVIPQLRCKDRKRIGERLDYFLNMRPKLFSWAKNNSILLQVTRCI